MIYWTIYLLVAVTLAVWTLRFVVLHFVDRIVPTLRPDASAASQGPALPPMSMVVAARNEEAVIESCLRSLLAQDYPNLELICVDDRSTDATPSILQRIAAEDSRLKVAHVAQLAPGWFGKNNAMRDGVAMASGDWLCFTDADCTFESPTALSTAMRHAMEKQADFLSILPEHEAHSHWERLIQPACSAIIMLWFSPIAVNRGKVAYANGAFMLMRRSCYNAIGGHASVRNEVNEDIHLARRAQAAGQRLIVSSARGLYTVRMYDSFARIWSGWTRIFTGSFARAAHIVRAIFVLGFFTFVPWTVFLLSDVVPSWRESSWLGLTSIAAASCLLQLATMALFYRLSRVSFWYGLIYPIGAVVAMGALINALKCSIAGGSFVWRGTRYRNGMAESMAEPTAREAA